ncbi:MAG: hypothetical protein K0V04_16105 [Deltaproteobacteria bacterium]|nr:hypothetical protein [Deltaproteobacteria bacterium]
MNPFPILILGAALVVWVASKATKPKPRPNKRLGQLRAKRLLWRESEARAAACAAIGEGVTDESVAATVVAEAIYPEHSWPPGEDAKQQRVWGLILDVVRDALAGGCDA